MENIIASSPSATMESEPNKNSKRTLKKIIYNVLVVLGIGISSMVSTQAAKNVYSDHFNATYFVAYTTTIFNVLMFPAYLIIHLIVGFKPKGVKQLLEHCIEPYKRENECRGRTYFRAWWVLIIFTALWISAIYTYIKSLRYLIPTDVSTLFATSNMFVFIMSIIILKESFYFTKLLSVIIAGTGVFVFFYSEKFKFDKNIGIAIALATSFLSAFYKVIYKVIIKHGTMAQVCFTLTMIGINTALYYWPVILILHYTGAEVLSQAKYIPWKELSVRGSCSIIMNFFITFGIAFISSLVASVGGILAIPLNAIVDVVLKRKTANALKAVGSILIVGSLSLLLIPDKYLDKFESFWKRPRRNLEVNDRNPKDEIDNNPHKSLEV